MSQGASDTSGAVHVTGRSCHKGGSLHVTGASCHKEGSACHETLLAPGGSAATRGFCHKGGCACQGVLVTRGVVCVTERCSDKGGSMCMRALLTRGDSTKVRRITVFSPRGLARTAACGIARGFGVAVCAQMPVLSSMHRIEASQSTPRPPRGRVAQSPRVSGRAASTIGSLKPLGPALARPSATARSASAHVAPTGRATSRLAESSGHVQQPTRDNTEPIGQRWALPAGLQHRLDSWGHALKQRVASCRARWLQQHAGRIGVSTSWPPPKEALVVGTDCSGAEAPIWSLRSMDIPHRHVFSCDVSPSVRKFIAQCSPPEGPVFHDMLQRDAADIPAHSIYVCGFPCTPFSRLRQHSTKLLREPAAKPFFESVRSIRQSLPPVAILENVLGIRQVMTHVVSYFARLGWYYVLVIPIDSAELGEPVKRPRYYFVLLRRDVAIIRDRQKLADLATAMLVAARTPCKDTIVDRMLPRSHSAVREYVARYDGGSRNVSVSRRRSTTQKPPAKWITHSANYMRSHGLSGPVPSMNASCDMRGLRLPRTRAVWSLLCRAHASPTLVADVSQNVHRAPVCVDGSSPTITPGGVIAVKTLGRIMVPIEKLLAHNFPVHKMRMSRNVTDKDLESLGGNTMHLASVGLALLIGMAGVDWSASAAKVGQKPVGDVPPTEPAIYIDRAGAVNEKRSGRKRRMPPPADLKKATRR